MRYSNVLLPKNKFYLILTICSLMILGESLMVIVNIRGLSDFVHTNQSLSFEYGQILTAFYLMSFVMRVIPIMMLGIHSYISFMKVPITKFFVFIWGVVLLGIFMINLLEFSFNSFFYYFKLIGLLVLVLTIFNLMKIIKSKNKL